MSPEGERPAGEPASAAEARAWVESRLRSTDRFAALADATERHRAEHRCNAWASADGPLLGVLARATRARRILEIGTALGYSAAWLAEGAPDARVDSFDADPAHAEAAQAQLRSVGLAERVRVHVGRSPEALVRLDPGSYDLIFYDAHVPTPDELDVFHRLLRPGGLLVSSNLFLGQYYAALPGLEKGAEYRAALFDAARWLTSFADLKALSVRL